MVRIPYVNKFESQMNLPCKFPLLHPCQCPFALSTNTLP